MRARLLSIGLALVAGCGSNNAASTLAKPPEYPTTKETKCGVVKSQSEPLIVEWPDAARGKLESLRRQGMVAVSYKGCELQVLRCHGPTQYQYVPLTRKQNRLVIKNEDELYANLPVGAVTLEGKLKTAGQLNVEMTLVGRYELNESSVTRDQLQGDDCDAATHVVGALTVGAFTFSAGSEASVGAGVRVMGVGEGASSSAAKEMLQRDGEDSACQKSTGSDTAPPDGCGALIRLEVLPVREGRRASTARVDREPVRCARRHHVENGVCVDDEPSPQPTSTPSWSPSPAATSSKRQPVSAPTTAPKTQNGPFHITMAWTMLAGYGLGVVGAAVAAADAKAVTSSTGEVCNPDTKYCNDEGLSKKKAAIAWGWASTAGFGVGVLSTLLFYVVPKTAAPVQVAVDPIAGGASLSALGRF
jgi:hypothetical protein